MMTMLNVIGVPGDKVEYKMIHYMSMAKTR